MMNPRRLTRSEYWWQPLQLPRRLWRIVSGRARAQETTVTLPWRYPLTIAPRESIGRSILALNTLDLPVTEAIWRLLEPGEVAADVGANIGYMTSVMAARLRAGGTVWSFEPMPQLARRLRAHVAAWEPLGRATFEVLEMAVSDRNEPADLFTPADWADNHGTATLQASASDTRIRVQCCTLDEVFATATAPKVMKVDVEGCEAQVFRGAARLLSAQRIRDIVFEEMRAAPTETISLLRSHGYTVFRILRRFAGPHLAPAESAAAGEIDPPTYLGTAAPERALQRFATRGWYALRQRTPR